MKFRVTRCPRIVSRLCLDKDPQMLAVGDFKAPRQDDDDDDDDNDDDDAKRISGHGAFAAPASHPTPATKRTEAPTFDMSVQANKTNIRG